MLSEWRLWETRLAAKYCSAGRHGREQGDAGALAKADWYIQFYEEVRCYRDPAWLSWSLQQHPWGNEIRSIFTKSAFPWSLLQPRNATLKRPRCQLYMSNLTIKSYRYSTTDLLTELTLTAPRSDSQQIASVHLNQCSVYLPIKRIARLELYYFKISGKLNRNKQIENTLSDARGRGRSRQALQTLVAWASDAESARTAIHI